MAREPSGGGRPRRPRARSGADGRGSAGPAAVAALLVLMGAAMAPARARAGAPDPRAARHPAWVEIGSDRFAVLYQPGLDSVALRVLDLAERTDVVLARRLGCGPGRRVPIVVRGACPGGPRAGAAPEPLDGTLGECVGLHRGGIQLRFTGSYEELRRALVRGLVRASVPGKGPAPGLRAVPAPGAAPGWLVEGLAEYVALGMDADAEMFLRDGIVEGTLVPLADAEGRALARQGQSAVHYLVRRHGEERLRELLRRTRRSHAFERTFRRTLGRSVRTFEAEWRDWLRREYWPAAARGDAERFAWPLTDHQRDGGTMNTAPAVAPQGDRVAYYSDRLGSTDLYVLSALDGQVRRRVMHGRRDCLSAAAPALRGGIAWSPDGSRLAVTADGGERDVVLIVAAASGRVLRRLALDCDALADPSWSPVADSLVVAGVRGGCSDLWLVDAGTGRSERLTADAWDDREPCWAPDGRTITFTSDRVAPLVLRPEPIPGGFGRQGLYDLDLASRAVTERLVTPGGSRAPAWSPDGRKLAFVTDRGGVAELVLLDTRDGTLTPLTEVLGGIGGVSWARGDDRLVFSALRRGGFDLFAAREPVSVDAVLARLRRERAAADAPGACPSGIADEPAGVAAEPAPDVLAGSIPARLPVRARARVTLDHAAGGIRAATGFGCAVSARLEVGDLVGVRRLSVTADVVRGPVDRANALVLARHAFRRWDVHGGLFRYGDYRAERHAATEEALDRALPFTERSVGGVLGVSRALDAVRRLDLDVSQHFVVRTSAADGGHPRESPTSAAVSLIGDDALWGPTGPVSGGRFRLTFSPSFAWLADGVTRRNVTVDARRYWPVTSRHVLAGRLLAGRSDGRDARAFRVGGFATLRGVPLDRLAGTRAAVASAELRFPFVDRLGLLGPVPLGRLALRGAVFADAGLVWNRGERLRLSRVADGVRRLDSPVVAFGTGVRTRAGGLVVKLDVVWRADRAGVGEPHWEFSLAPEF